MSFNKKDQGILSVSAAVLALTLLLSSCARIPKESNSPVPTGDTVHLSDVLSAAPSFEEGKEGDLSYNLDRTEEDISFSKLPDLGEAITAEELFAPMEPGEFRTYCMHFDGKDFVYSSMYRFRNQSRSGIAANVYGIGRSISFLIGQGNLTPFETAKVSSNSDYAYVIQTLAKRQYREATEADRNSAVGNTAFLICYIENPDGTTDLFWCDADLHVLHREGTVMELPDMQFTDISTEPLTEEEYSHLHVIASSYLYANTDIAFRPFKYDSLTLHDEMPSSMLSVKVEKDGREIVFDEKDVDRIVEVVRNVDAATAEMRSLYTATPNGKNGLEALTHVMAIKKNEHNWEEGIYHDDFYLKEDGSVIRKLDILISSTVGGSEGMRVRGPFIVCSQTEYPIEDIISDIIYGSHADNDHIK